MRLLPVGIGAKSDFTLSRTRHLHEVLAQSDSLSAYKYINVTTPACLNGGFRRTYEQFGPMDTEADSFLLKLQAQMQRLADIGKPITDKRLVRFHSPATEERVVQVNNMKHNQILLTWTTKLILPRKWAAYIVKI